jgi:hypothetical protein
MIFIIAAGARRMAEQTQKRMKVASARCCYRATRDIPSRYRKAHTRSRNIRLSRAYHSCAFSHYICLNVNFTERERERKPNIYRDYSNYSPRCSRCSSCIGHFIKICTRGEESRAARRSELKIHWKAKSPMTISEPWKKWNANGSRADIM